MYIEKFDIDIMITEEELDNQDNALGLSLLRARARARASRPHRGVRARHYHCESVWHPHSWLDLHLDLNFKTHSLFQSIINLHCD